MLGADRKQVAWLAGLVVVMLAVFYYEFFAGDSAPSPTSSASPPPAAPTMVPMRARQIRTEARRTAVRSGIGDWKPRLGPKNPEDRPDPAMIDPTLRLDLLARVQGVEAGAPGRNLFVFGAAPPPVEAKIPLPKVGKIAINQPPATAPPPFVPQGPPPAPQAPPITLKYYGYKVSKTDGHKAAFLLDGDDILIAGENDTLKRRYRVVRIGVSSITIEDTQFKTSQTLPLQENFAG